VMAAGRIAIAGVALAKRLEQCRNARAAATQSTAPARNVWTVATEEGVHNVKCYMFETEQAANHFASEITVAWVMYDDCVQELKHGDLNPWALSTIRTSMSQSFNGKWKVATEEGPRNVQVYFFASEQNARCFMRGLFVARFLINPRGYEVHHGKGGNQLAVNTIRTRVLQDPNGRWKVATEEGPGNVRVYKFHNESNARIYLDGLFVARILVNPEGQEVHHGKGSNQLAVNTIRTRILQDPNGRWKVATEEGPGNIQVYKFQHESNARIYLDGLFVARILINQKGKEVGRGGWNPWALTTIRRRVIT